MSESCYKGLLTGLGCLADGRFVCPPDLREVTIIVSQFGGGVSMTVSRAGHPPAAWSYTDDFIIYQDGGGHSTYYAWSGVVAVLTNPQ
ncbi:MAG TPA: hypothetical protein VGM51_06145 [Armatimonadota bacterium]|jgi:hypothetical protein